jgi:erythronate-4-phosphate dehydrogenase
MKFIIDDKIPYIQGVLEQFVEVIYIPGAEITAENIKHADAIFIRTRTVCNEQFLSGSSVRFIATATIGYDHIDTDYCDKAGIVWTNAPGCNSKSVEQYIASVLFVLARRKNFQLKGKIIGVVGVGQVGSKVARVCELFGMKVLLNDPPRARAEKMENFCSLEEIIQNADIVTFHVPLNMAGKDATFHMADKQFFNALKRKPFVINSSRGEVMDSLSAKTEIQKGQISGLVIDCWENEPHIDLELLAMTDLASPHIAGYSRDGKANGTQMCIQAASRFFGLGIDNWQAMQIELPDQTTIELAGLNLSEEEILATAVLATYDLRKDDAAFRNNPELFEKLRGDYPVRREFTSYTIKMKNIGAKTKAKLNALGFKTEK